MNDTSTSLIHSDLMKYPVLGARLPNKKMSGGSEALFRCIRERSIVEHLNNAAVD